MKVIPPQAKKRIIVGVCIAVMSVLVTYITAYALPYGRRVAPYDPCAGLSPGECYAQSISVGVSIPRDCIRKGFPLAFVERCVEQHRVPMVEQHEDDDWVLKFLFNTLSYAVLISIVVRAIFVIKRKAKD